MHDVSSRRVNLVGKGKKRIQNLKYWRKHWSHFGCDVSRKWFMCLRVYACLCVCVQVRVEMRKQMPVPMWMREFNQRERERERPPCSGLVGSDQERRKLRCSRESKSCRVRLCELFRHCYWTKLFPKLTLKVLYQLDKVGEKKRLKRQHFLCPQARKLPLPLFSCTALFCLTRFQSWPCWSDLFSNCPWTSQPIMVFSLDRCW